MKTKVNDDLRSVFLRMSTDRIAKALRQLAHHGRGMPLAPMQQSNLSIESVFAK